MAEPQQTGIVSEARELDGWGILAMPPSCVPEMLTFDGAKRIDGLLRQLADEVERLDEQVRELTDECGNWRARAEDLAGHALEDDE